MGLLTQATGALAHQFSGNPLGTITSGVEALNGIASLFSKNNAIEKQYKYQKALAEQQQQYARENSLTAYNRQRELTRDQFSLNKEGMRAAGMNTAQGDNTRPAVASVDPIAPPGTGSVGLPQSDAQAAAMRQQSLDSVSRLLSDNASRSAAYEKDIAEAEGTRIDNITRMSRNIAQLRKDMASARNDEEKAIAQKAYNDAYNQYLAYQAQSDFLLKRNQVIRDNLDTSMYKDMKEAELNQMKANIKQTLENTKLTKQQRKNLKRQLGLIDAQIQDVKSHVSVNQSAAYKNYSDAALSDVKTEGQYIQNKIQGASFSSLITKIAKDSLPNGLYQKIQLWRKDGTFEKLDGLQQLGYGLYESLTEVGLTPEAIAKIIGSIAK